eukprot:8419160-Prorocentrum_lima.AAC.1
MTVHGSALPISHSTAPQKPAPFVAEARLGANTSSQCAQLHNKYGSRSTRSDDNYPPPSPPLVRMNPSFPASSTKSPSCTAH